MAPAGRKDPRRGGNLNVTDMNKRQRAETATAAFAALTGGAALGFGDTDPAGIVALVHEKSKMHEAKAPSGLARQACALPAGGVGTR